MPPILRWTLPRSGKCSSLLCRASLEVFQTELFVTSNWKLESHFYGASTDGLRIKQRAPPHALIFPRLGSS